MKVKKSEIYILVSGIIYVIVYYIWANSYNFYSSYEFSVLTSTYFYAVAHVIIAGILLIYLLRKMEIAEVRNTRSICSIGILSIIVYNYIASTKYAINKLYIGFIEDAFYKFMGEIYVDLIIFFLIFLWDHFNTKHVEKYNASRLISKLNCRSIAIFLPLYILVEFNGFIWNISIIDNMSETLVAFIDTFLCLCCIILSISNIKKRSFKSLARASVFLSTIVSIGFFQSLLSGKRHKLITPIIFALAVLYCTSNLKTKTIRKAVSVLPIALMIFSLGIFAFSARFESNAFWIVRDLAYRYDLSDFAVTVASKTSIDDRSLKSILEAVISAIPGTGNLNTQYLNVLRAAGLNIREDFNDTIFSVGAEIGGFIGMAIVPIIICMWLEWFDNYLKNSKFSVIRFSRLFTVFYFIVVEITWHSFILYSRNAILVILTCHIVFFIVGKIKLKRQYATI